MTLTTEYLEGYFKTFNEDYFEGSLPMPHIALSRSRTRLGSMACKRKLTLRGFRLTDFTIRLSTYYDFTERQAQNVLLHEMIHYYIAYHKLRDTSSHGTLFRKIMNTLNSAYGWDITVSSPTTGMKRNEIKKGKTYLILVMRTADRKIYTSVVNPKYSQEIEQRINNVSDIIWHKWFTSQDPFFTDMPAVRSLRGRKITEVKLHELLPKMREEKLPPFIT